MNQIRIDGYDIEGVDVKKNREDQKTPTITNPLKSKKLNL